MKKELRQEIHFKYCGLCAYCGKHITCKEMQVDHLYPQRLAHNYTIIEARIAYGCIGNNIDSFENLMPSCRRCNHYKRGHTLEKFRQIMNTLHKRIIKQYINKVAIDYNIINLTPFTGKFYFEK